MKATSLLLTAALAVVALPSFAQKATPKTKTKAPATTTAAPVKVADHVTGMVKKPGVKDGKFQIGSGTKKTRGTWTIDVSSATIADKKGTTIAADKLTSGSNVSVFGTIDSTAKTIKADKVQVNYLRGTKSTKVKVTKTPKTKIKPAGSDKGGTPGVGTTKAGGGN